MKDVIEPQRRIPVISEPDVLVVGAGAAGLAAACAAARAGVSTLLLERYGFLGGTLAAVTLGGICGAYAVIDEKRLGRVIGGIFRELEERLMHRDALLNPKRHGRIVGIPYDSVALKLVAEEMVAAHGVEVLFHSLVVGAYARDGEVDYVVIENKGGRSAIRPRVVIDCSGDGDVAVHAGAAYRFGDNGTTQFGSTMFRLGNVDTERAGALSRSEIRELLEHAVADGHPLPRTTTGVHVNPLQGIVHLNVTKVCDDQGAPFNLCDPQQLSAAEQVGRQQAFLYESVFREYVPGFENSRIVDIGAMIGIRETRLVEGERVLTGEMVRGCEKPDDRIACTAWPLEVHEGGRSTRWEFLPDGDYYGIPFGCLVAKGWSNLLVAGRNLSATHEAQASARVAAPCMAMGEAAGIAAATALREGQATHQLDIPTLQARLIDQGALLSPDLR